MITICKRLRVSSSCPFLLSPLPLQSNLVGLCQSRRSATTVLPSYLNKPKRLPEIVKLKELVEQDAATVTEIWKTYHKDNQRFLGDVITTLQYQKFKSRLEKSPFFALPLFSQQGNGFTVLVSQYAKQDGRLSLTGLEEYNTNPTHACPYLIFHMYTELSTLEHALVLVRGEIINPSMSKHQAERMWQFLQRFYLTESEHHYVERFNHDANSFDTTGFFNMLKRQP